MLQQGKFVADVIYYYSEDNNITALFGNKLPDVPQGYNYDFVNADALVNVLLVIKDMGMTWARSGTAVLVMDQICAGERTQTQAWPRESYYGRSAGISSQLYLAGESLIKWMAWDIMRGIDLLLERSYIDPNRIVLIGAVAGGNLLH